MICLSVLSTLLFGCDLSSSAKPDSADLSIVLPVVGAEGAAADTDADDEGYTSFFVSSLTTVLSCRTLKTVFFLHNPERRKLQLLPPSMA